MNLNKWAAKWNIPYAALEDLKRMYGQVEEPEVVVGNKPEAYVQSVVRLEATQKGLRLWRNNVGAVMTETGMLRFGLMNDSQKLNDKCKSSDLIGIRPVLITQEMVGHTIGQFVAREIKHEGWKYSGTPREEAQLTFLELVAGLGGDARFATKVGTL